MYLYCHVAICLFEFEYISNLTCELQQWNIIWTPWGNVKTFQTKGQQPPPSSLAGSDLDMAHPMQSYAVLPAQSISKSVEAQYNEKKLLIKHQFWKV